VSVFLEKMRFYFLKLPYTFMGDLKVLHMDLSEFGSLSTDCRQQSHISGVNLFFFNNE
jgi:hypothetical protein